MIRLRFFRTFLPFFLLLLAPPSGAQRLRRSTPVSSPPADDQGLRTMEAAVLQLVNTHRADLGLSLLQQDGDLAALALQHSADMAGGKVAFGHDGFDARSKAYAKTAGGFVSGMAENVAYNSTSAEMVMDGWLHSSGHRRNIEGRYNRVGIGIARDREGRLYFTQIFANR